MDFTHLWVFWLALFPIIEAAALILDHRDKAPDERTLSHHLRAWFHVREKWGRWLWVATGGIGAAWLLVHIAVPGSV